MPGTDSVGNAIILSRAKSIITVPFYSSVFGLRLQANQPIPGLPVIGETSEVDVEFCLGEKPQWPEAELAALERTQPWYESPELGENGNPCLIVWKVRGGSCFRFLYDDRTEFFLERQGTRVWGTWPPELSLENAAIYVRGQILGFLLRLRGFTCLHASAIAVGDQVIAFAGPAGAGKSTTAAFFAKLNFPVVADDEFPILDRGNSFLVHPGFPRLSLWPDAVQALYGTPEALPLLTPTWDKRYADLNHNGQRLSGAPLRLAAIYILGERETGRSAAWLEELAASPALMDLVANTYLNFLPDYAMRARDFALLGRLVPCVPVKRVRSSADCSNVKDLCQAIAEDAARLLPGADAALEALGSTTV